MYLLAAFKGVVEFGKHLSRRCYINTLQMQPGKNAPLEFGHGLCLLTHCPSLDFTEGFGAEQVC